MELEFSELHDLLESKECRGHAKGFVLKKAQLHQLQKSLVPIAHSIQTSDWKALERALLLAVHASRRRSNRARFRPLQALRGISVADLGGRAAEVSTFGEIWKAALDGKFDVLHIFLPR